MRVYDACLDRGWQSVLLCGVSELAEIAAIKAVECQIDLAGAFDSASSKDAFLNRRVLSSLEDARAADVFLVTAIDDPWFWAANSLSDIEPERIFVPDICGPGAARRAGQ